MGMGVKLVDSMGDDIRVVNAARVSFKKESDWEVCGEGDTKYLCLSERDRRLIHFLARNNHFSPFTHCFATFQVRAPFFVRSQLVRHTVGFAWNEMSRRYIEEEPEFYLPLDWRGKPEHNKQGSGERLDGGEQLIADREYWNAVRRAEKAYKELLELGVAPEMARMVLPEATMTEWYWTGSLYAWARMCNLRIDSHVQKETRFIAKMISEDMEKLFPCSWKALTKEEK